jgi:uncharacterized protein (TIGR02996 family)
VLDDLRGAIAASDWPRALHLALAAWREHRAVALADLVDAIGARCAIAPPQNRRDTHAWWIAHAAPYDPIAVHALATQFGTRGRAVAWKGVTARWGTTNPLVAAISATLPTWWGTWSYTSFNHLDRLAAMTTWPDDPRVSALLTRIAVTPDASLPRNADLALLEHLGAWLVRLGDLRAIPALRERITEPYDRERAPHFQRTVDLLRARPEPSAELVRAVDELAAILPKPPPPRDLAPLWAEIAAHPDDVGPRLILGDALVEAGELRGEVISLQCNAKQAHRPLRSAHRDRSDGRVRTIVRLEFARWLGDLALVLARRGCELRNGMFEVVQVGRGETPPWAWSKVRGHRELACVHTVRPGTVTPEQYAGFIAALPREPQTLGITDPAQVPGIAAIIPLLGTRRLEYQHHFDRDPRRPMPLGPPLLGTFEAIAKLAPALEEIAFLQVVNPDELVNVVRLLPARFPALRKILVRTSQVPASRFLLVKEAPLVELVP